MSNLSESCQTFWGISSRSLLVYSSTIIVAGSMAYLWWALPTDHLVSQLRSWSTAEGYAAELAFVFMYVVFTVCSMPVWPLPFLAGSLFGTFWGSVLSSASCVLAAAVTFGIARVARLTVLNSFISRSPRVAAVGNLLRAGSWKIIAAVRVSHLMTFGIQNYILGSSNVHFGVYLFTTWLVTLPGTILQVYLGDLGYSSMEAWRDHEATPWHIWTIQVVGVIAMGTAIAYFSYGVKKKYLQEVQRQLEQQIHDAETEGSADHFTWQMCLLLLVDAIAVGLVVWVWSTSDIR